ncbi:LAFA_0D01442g1_1 [Lachancea sp. 'fantastica']|nr:LAFA_0D01442g1_1 [Lachancea sp. 'fantastica']
MDAFALKKDNRKKFQDKEKLKRKHATPSDRKYRALNKTTEPEPELPELQANHYRYHEDLSMTYPQHEEDLTSATTTKKLKEVLQARQNSTNDNQSQSKSPGLVTKKQLDSMSVDELNSLLGNKKKSPDASELSRSDECENNLNSLKKKSKRSPKVLRLRRTTRRPLKLLNPEFQLIWNRNRTCSMS